MSFTVLKTNTGKRAQREQPYLNEVQRRIIKNSTTLRRDFNRLKVELNDLGEEERMEALSGRLQTKAGKQFWIRAGRSMGMSQPRAENLAYMQQRLKEVNAKRLQFLSEMALVPECWSNHHSM